MTTETMDPETEEQAEDWAVISSPERRLLKFKCKGKGEPIFIAWQERARNGEWDTASRECTEEGCDELYAAKDALGKYVEPLCEIDAPRASCTVTGVSLSYSDADIMTATLTAQRTLQNSQCPMNLNTPPKPESPHSEGDPDAWDFCLPSEVVACIDELAMQAFAYLDGHRAQMNLPFDLEQTGVMDTPNN